MEEIVKYKNRKLYSRTSKRYVNLTEIKEMVQNKTTVKVVDFNGNDITATTLSKVVALTDAPVNELETIINNN